MDKMYLGFVKADPNAVKAFMGMLFVAAIIIALVFVTPHMIVHTSINSGEQTAISTIVNVVIVGYCWIFSLAFKDWKIYTN